MNKKSIKYVRLESVPHPVHRIIEQLHRCRGLTSLHIIIDLKDIQSRAMLADVLPRLTQLQCLGYGYMYQCLYSGEKCPEADPAVVRAIEQHQALIHLDLKRITLTDTVTLPQQLESVYMESITLNDTVTLPTQLESVKLIDVDSANFILQSINQCNVLKSIELASNTLTDTVTLPSQLQEVKLDEVKNAHLIMSSLPGCHQLTSLHIRNLNTSEECKSLANTLPDLQSLQVIHYDGGWSNCYFQDHAAVFSALQRHTQLTNIVLKNIVLQLKATLLVTPDMTRLLKLELKGVKMLINDFVTVLKHATQLTHIKLSDVDMSGYGRDCTSLVIPQTLQEMELDWVRMVSGRWEEFFFSLQYATKLTHLKLSHIDLQYRGTPLFTPHMTQLQRVELEMVDMTALHEKMPYSRWSDCINSLCRVKQPVHVILKWIDINTSLLEPLYNSHHSSEVRLL